MSITVIKVLFAASPNVCSYTGCDEKLTDPSWREVNAEIAHICGERTGAPRFDPVMSVDDRNAYENLMLLCPKHHKLIDRLDPEGHPVELLREMKAKSEMHGSTSRPWATDSALIRFAVLLASSVATGGSTPAPESTPRLQVRKSGKRITMYNAGSASAESILVVDDEPTESPVLIGEIPDSLPAHARFDIGHWVQTFGTRSSARLTITWDDVEGNTYVETFPVN